MPDSTGNIHNVYEEVSANKFKSVLIITLFVAFVSLVGYLITYYFNLGNGFLILAIAFSIFSAVSSYFWGDKIVLSLNNARPASREEFFDFYTVVENLSLGDQLPMPKIYVINDPSPNAFATGRDPNHAVVCATTGLLDSLDRTELEGVIAHELSHVKNYDTRLLMIVSILIGTLTILINFANRSMLFGNSRSRNENNGGGLFAIIGFALIIFAPLIAQLIQLAISRRREYLADASAVKLTRQPQGLIDALTKISGYSEPMQSASTATANLYIVNPFKGIKLASLFSTHPPIEDRIRALKAMM